VSPRTGRRLGKITLLPLPVRYR